MIFFSSLKIQVKKFHKLLKGATLFFNSSPTPLFVKQPRPLSLIPVTNRSRCKTTKLFAVTNYRTKTSIVLPPNAKFNCTAWVSVCFWISNGIPMFATYNRDLQPP